MDFVIPFNIISEILYPSLAVEASNSLDREANMKADVTIDSQPSRGIKRVKRASLDKPHGARTIEERLLSFILANLYSDIRAQVNAARALTSEAANDPYSDSGLYGNFGDCNTPLSIALLFDLQLLCEYDAEICEILLCRFRETQALGR